MSLASRILEELKQKVSTLTMIPSDGGCFEVSKDGKTIFSKLEQGRFPEESEVLAQLR